MDYDDLIPVIEEELTSRKHDIELKQKFKDSYHNIYILFKFKTVDCAHLFCKNTIELTR